jgi:hypothetical protein
MSKNIAEIYFKRSKNNLNDYLTLIMGEKGQKNLQKNLINSYMEARYYNYADDYGNINTNIDKYLKDSIKPLLKDNDHDLLNNYLSILSEMYGIDSTDDENLIRNKINAINNKRIQKMSLSDKRFNDKLYKMIKLNQKDENKYLNSFNSEYFFLDINKIKKLNVYDVKLAYNIEFNTLYSNYAIINAFNTGLVNENKMEVLYYLYGIMLLKNIIKGEFKKEYLLDFDVNLFNKPKKLNMILNIINSDPIKELTALKVSYNDFNTYKNEFYDLKRNGYNIAVIIDSSYEESDINFTKLQLFKYVIINNEEYKYDSLLSLPNLIIL